MTTARLNNAALTGGTAPAAVLAAHARATGEALQAVPVVALTRSPWQPRTAVDVGSPDFAALVDSIRERGVLEPLLARALPGGALELLAGERRLEAARAAGLAKVPVRVLAGLDDLAAREVALVENLARSDLSPWDEAQALGALAAALEAAGRVASRRALASLAGRSSTAVHRALTIAERCTDDVRAAAAALLATDVPSWNSFPGATLEGIAKGETVAVRARLLAIAARSYAPTARPSPGARKARTTPQAVTWATDAKGRGRLDIRKRIDDLTPAEARRAVAVLEPVLARLTARASRTAGVVAPLPHIPLGASDAD
jgi:ParB/RepB/Spo0J family partition protein